MDTLDHQQSENSAGNSRRGTAMPPLACYANYFEVGHNAFEFLLDAGQVEPQSGEIRFTNRIAISPVHAKLLSELLAVSIAQFEDAHQAIPDISANPEICAGETEALGLTCLDDFERRALDARRRAAAASGADPVSQER